jgi:hypothetical protein
LNLSVLRPIRIFHSKNITTDSVIIAGALMPLLVLSDFSAKPSSTTAGSSMPTHPTQRNGNSPRYQPLSWNSSYPADTVRLTASLWISLGGQRLFRKIWYDRKSPAIHGRNIAAGSAKIDQPESDFGRSPRGDRTNNSEDPPNREYRNYSTRHMTMPDAVARRRRRNFSRSDRLDNWLDQEGFCTRPRTGGRHIVKMLQWLCLFLFLQEPP